MNTPFHEQKKTGRTIAADFLASLVVFLVALPLCMGIAIACGAPVTAGLVTGIVGGIVVGCLGGAPLQVSGPAAGLTVICAEVIGDLGLAALGIVVLIAGAIQLLAGVCRLGQWFRAISPAVVHGMLAGIGVLILSSQLHVMVDDRPQHSGLANLLSIPEAIAKGLPLPTWESRERREARLAQLQQFGNLHQRQSELVNVMRSSQLAPDDPSANDPLANLANLQRDILEEVQHSPGIQDDRALKETRDAAEGALANALADLEFRSVTRSAESVGNAQAALESVLSQLKNHDWAAKIGALSIALIITWQAFAPKSLQFIPGPLLAVVVTTAVAWAASLPVLYVELPERLIDGLVHPDFRVLTSIESKQIFFAGLFMAVIASAETLLCAGAIDRMQAGHRTNYDRELAAQGLGNILCGLIGGLPMTGVIVRSAANVQAGARTQLSAVLHGIWLLIFVVLCGLLLRLIPTAALAGILVYTGFRLIGFREFFRLWQHDRSEAIIMLTTLVVIVVDDLLTGVLVGFALSAVKLLVRFTRLEVRISPFSHRANEPCTTVQIAGAATFLRLPILARHLDEVPADGDVRIELTRLAYLDQACLELLQSWIAQREAEGQRISIDRQHLKAVARGGTSRLTAVNATSTSWSPAAAHRPPSR